MKQELIDLLKENSAETLEVLKKINDITKNLSQNAAESQKFLDGLKINTMADSLVHKDNPYQ